MAALGVGDESLAAGIENIESCFFNRFGQLIYNEPRGTLSGYKIPEVGIHCGRLHLILFRAALARGLAPTTLRVDQDEEGVTTALGGVQTRCGILALRYQRGLALTGPLHLLETDEHLLECCGPAPVNVALAVNEWRPS